MVRNSTARNRLRQCITAIIAAFATSASAVVITPASAAVAPSAKEQAGERDVVPFPKPRFEVDLQKDVRVAMRDGVGLYADIYRPRGAGERMPTIMLRTQYDKAPYRDPASKTGSGVAHMFAGQGFTVVVQDIRGRFRSEGTFHPATSDADDGYDTVAWVASQPWSNGKVGGYGCSALGINQVMMSQRQPPALKALVPQGPAGALRYRPFDVIVSGVPEIGWAFQWFVQDANQLSQPFPNVDLYEGLKTLPLADAADRVGSPPTDWRDWMTHEAGDPWWDKFPFFDETSRPDVPALFVNSWYDTDIGETAKLFNMFQKQSTSEKSRRNQFIIISPTAHCQSEQARTPHMVGERDVGDVRRDYWSVYLNWYNHWLRDGDGDVKMPHVQYYLMGANRWKSADSWPLPGTRFTPYYFSSRGHANTSKGDGSLSTAMASGPADNYRYDPLDPVPSPENFAVPPRQGGRAELRSPGNATDQRQVDLRQDRLVFTSEPLRSGLEVTGPLKAVLYVSSSARDTDFVVQLSDVYPDGRVYNLRTGIARARYREGYKQPKLMTPGEIYPIEVDMQATGNWFAPGHRIRVQVSSSSFPHFARNLNTGGNNATESTTVVAKNTIYHDRAHPSHILLPVVP